MALIVDKHRPRSLDALTYHNELSDRLRSLAQSGDFPHLLVYGPSGAGKKTRIVATLKELYGPGVEKIKIDARVFQTSSNRKLEFNIVASVYHLEITPSDVGNYDRVVVQDLLKEVAQTQQVDQSAKQRFKVVVINEADHLSRDAQAALRRTMEKYSPNLRLILLANSTSNIIAPIRSRTLLVRVAAPTHDQICEVLAHAAKKEGWEPAAGLHKRIAVDSGRNLRKALLMYEAVHAQNEKVTDSTPIPPADWEALIGQIAKEIMDEHTPARILQVRAKLYDLLTHCIPATTILKTLTFKLLAMIDDGLKGEVIRWSAFYEHRVKTGTKVIFHLEAFVAKFMRIFEMYLMSMDMYQALPYGAFELDATANPTRNIAEPNTSGCEATELSAGKHAGAHEMSAAAVPRPRPTDYTEPWRSTGDDYNQVSAPPTQSQDSAEDIRNELEQLRAQQERLQQSLAKSNM